jgi:ketosteroid isomerase-like protein
VPSENVVLAREAYEAFNRLDLGAVLERLDPAIEWRMHEQFTRAPRVYTGHDGVRQVFDAFHENFDDFRTEPREFIEVGERLVIPVRMRGRQKGSGTPVEIDLVQVWTTRNGRATALDVYSTKEEALSSVNGA